MTAAHRFAIIVVATLLAGAIGLLLGEPLGYALAKAVDRDAAEIKDTFIWCAVLTPLVCAAAGGWLASVAVRSRVRRSAMWVFFATATLCSAIVFASYDRPKTAGIPVFEYELTMPAAIRADGIGNIDLTIWDGKSGKGCYIREVKIEGARRRISGSITLLPDNPDPMLSIAFHDGERWTSGGAWAFRYEARDQIEPHFRTWETIAFSGKVRDLPIPQGDFLIRYRLRRFM